MLPASPNPGNAEQNQEDDHTTEQVGTNHEPVGANHD